MEREHWYVLRTDKGKEYEGAALISPAVDKNLYTRCSIPRKAKPFRHGGVYRPMEAVMFPGYLFIRSAQPGKLHKQLQKSREFPQFVIFGKDKTGEDELVPVSVQDLSFLQGVCGRSLQSVMGITYITLGDDKQLLEVKGVLERYVELVVKWNLHKRVAVAEVPLFNRTQEILFGIRLKQDEYIGA